MEFKQVKARAQQFLTERTATQKFATLGLALSLVMFFNYPTLLEVVIRTGIFTATMTIVGYCFDRFGIKGLVISFLLILIIALTSTLVTYQCLIGDPYFGPHENPVTGEVDYGKWDGFRLMECDKGEFPWYYEDVSWSEKKEWCSEEGRESIIFCKGVLSDSNETASG